MEDRKIRIKKHMDDYLGDNIYEKLGIFIPLTEVVEARDYAERRCHQEEIAEYNRNCSEVKDYLYLFPKYPKINL